VSKRPRSQQDRVSRTLVRSQVKGEVKQVKITTIGGVIQAGMYLIEIVPIEGDLLVEAPCNPQILPSCDRIRMPW
jgi:adhesin transport system membrane fusion protein